MNPSSGTIITDGPCDPADTIQDLLDAGTLNNGQATALGKVLGKNVLAAWVSAGILTENEAELLLLIDGL